MKKKDKNELIVSIMVMLLGSGLLYGAWLLTEDTRRFLANSYVVNSTVISYDFKTSRHATKYSPKVTFTSKTGLAIQAQSTWWSKHQYRFGEQIALRVANDDPCHFSPNTLGSLWGFSLLLWFLGGGSFLIGLFIAITALLRIRKHH